MNGFCKKKNGNFHLKLMSTLLRGRNDFQRDVRDGYFDTILNSTFTWSKLLENINLCSVTNWESEQYGIFLSAKSDVHKQKARQLSITRGQR